MVQTSQGENMKIKLTETCTRIRLKSPLDVFLPLFTIVSGSTEYLNPLEVVRAIYLASVLNEMMSEIKAKVAPIEVKIVEKYLRREPLLREVISASLEDEMQAESTTHSAGEGQYLEAYVCTSNNMMEFEIGEKEAKILQLEGSNIVELSLKDFIEKAFQAALNIDDITLVARALYMLRASRGKVEI